MDADKQHRSPARNVVRSALAAIPTLLVLASIAAVGIWGHHTGWKAPKLSQLVGSKTAEPEDWCEAHNVPDSRCIACYPELAGESGVEWCKEHGLPESKCTVCHPEILVTGVAGDWCREHGLPESGCTLCHPEIARRGELPVGADAVEVTVAGGQAGSASPPDGADATPSATIRDPSTCQTHSLKVQFASVGSMEKSGIRLGQVVERPMAESFAANAQVDYDRTRFAKVSSRVAGTVRHVERDLGQAVRAGEVLALIESAEVGRAKAELLQAQAAVDVTARAAARLRVSSEAGFRTESERLEAEGNAREAEIRLFNARQAIGNLGLALPDGPVDEATLVTLGLPESASGIAAGTANLIPLVAPFDGVVVGRAVVAGEVVEPGATLFEVADTARMWVTMDVAESEANRVAVGGKVVFRQDHAPDAAVAGQIAWMSTAVDEMTRTVKVRVDVPNPAGTLRAHSFGRAQIELRTSPRAIAVPNEALQWEGCCHIVFVRLADEIFQTRKVRLGAKDLAYTEVLGGVLPGEVVVTAGSHVLKSEILKSKLGAGCCVE